MPMPVITTTDDAHEYWLAIVDRIFGPVPDGLNCDVALASGETVTLRVLGDHRLAHEGWPAIAYREVDDDYEPVGPIKYLSCEDFTGLEIC